jgi:hypothetical protein
MMPFKPGHSGNPAGRKPGSRNRASQMLETLIDGQADALAQKAVELALQGNATLLKSFIERLAPERRGRSIELDLGSISNSADLAAAHIKVLNALSSGKISAEEAVAISKVIDSTRVGLRAHELLEEDARERQRIADERAEQQRRREEQRQATAKALANLNRQSLI